MIALTWSSQFSLRTKEPFETSASESERSGSPASAMHMGSCREVCPALVSDSKEEHELAESFAFSLKKRLL